MMEFHDEISELSESFNDEMMKFHDEMMKFQHAFSKMKSWWNDEISTFQNDEMRNSRIPMRESA